jgi:hypothetical protein
MHHRRSRLLLLAPLATFVLTGCFSPSLPETISCGEDGTCPPGLRCETSANICVDPNQAGVSELYFETQPATVEAGVDAPEVVVQLRDAAGAIVPVTGGTFGVELAPNDQGVNLLGSVIHPAAQGVVSFDKLQFDRPARGLRLIVHGGDLSATSEPFDVTTTRPAILGVSVAGIIDSCATVTYQLQQAQSLPVDLLVEFDPDGPQGPLPFRRATQAPSAPGKAGVKGVSGSPQGRARTFTWNTTADVPRVDAAGELRITPSIEGVPGTAFTTPMTVSNGPRFIALPVGGSGTRIFRLVDVNGDGLVNTTSYEPSTHSLLVEDLVFPIPDGETIRDAEVADLDGDGLLDVAVSLSSTTVVAWQQREPRGQFGAAVEIGASFVHLASADLDRDGLADLVGVDGATGDVVVLRATRLAPRTIAEVARPWRGGDTGRVHAADLDRDGWPDLVIGRVSPSGAVAVVRNSVVGLASPTTDTGLFGDVLDAADLDGDGRDEIASLDASGLHVAAAGGRVDFPDITGRVLALHDVDGDTLPDVVTATSDHVYLSPHLGARLQIAFGPRVVVGPAQDVTALFVGDHERDGRIDILAPIVGDDFSTVVDFISSMPRRCNPRLAGPISSGNGLDNPHGVLADVNGDGKLDLVTEAGGFQSHRELVADLGQGDGTFVRSPDVLYALREGSSSRSLTAVDLDGDGAVDLALVDAESHAVSLAYNDAVAPGTFFGIDLALPLPQALAVADVDHDQVPDLVILASGQVQIRRGDPVARRQLDAPVVLPTVVDTTDELGWCRWFCTLRVSDLDADGDEDLLVQTEHELFLFVADASQPLGYAAPVDILGSAQLVDVLELVGDARPEILVVEQPGDPAAHLAAYDLKPGLADAEKVWDLPGVTGTMLPIDLDGDGRRELLVDAADGLAEITPGSPDGPRPLEPRFFPRLNHVLAVADVDSDGHDDLVVTGFGPTAVIRMGDHGPIDLGTRLTTRGTAETGGYGNELALGDFTGDGLLDLANRDSVAHTVTLTAQSTELPGTMAAREWTLGAWNFSGLADLDGDRRADLITYGNDASLVYLDPTSETPGGLCRAPVSAFPFVVADLTGDGRMDVVATSDTDVLVFASPADACVAPISVMSLDRPGVPHWYPEGLVVADLNRDGLLDVVVGTNAIRVALQRPDAPGTFDVSDYETNNDPNAWPYRDLTVADLDEDGDLDVVVIDEKSGVRIFTGDGQGALEPSQLVPGSALYSGRESVSVADVNGDGQLDIVTAEPDATDVFLQVSDPYNAATGVFAFAYSTLGAHTADYDADRAFVVDFDSDGRQDVVYVDPAQGTMLLRGR